jgi:hypothetical protein
LVLPIAVHEDHKVFFFLAESLRDVLIEQHVTVRNDQILSQAFPRAESFVERIQLTGFSKVIVIEIGQIPQGHRLLLIPTDDRDVLDPHGVVGVHDVRQNRRALNFHHRLGLMFRQLPEFLPAGSGQHNGGRVFGAAGKVPVFSIL